MVVDALEETALLQLVSNGFPGFEAILTRELAAVGGDACLGVDDLDLFEAVPLPDLEVERVVSGGDLDGTRSELEFDAFVGDDRDLAVEQREADQKRLAIIVRSLEADVGFLLDPSGETLHLVDETGRLLDEDAELCIVTDLLIRTESPKVIAVPISATMGVNRLAREANIELRYTRNNHLAMMEAAQSGECDFVGGTRGGFIFPRWLFASDAIFASIKILEMMAASNVKLSVLADALPDYVRAQREVRCPFDKTGMVMRRLIEKTASRPRDVIDGVRVYTQDSWVLVIPDQEHPVFHLIAEARTKMRLAEVLDEYETMLKGWL